MNSRKKEFLTKKFKILEISFPRIITGIVIGLLFSFVFYSFSYVMREILRMFSGTFNYDLWVLTNEEVNFYNLFFAFVSVIFGQSVCFNFWLDRPKRLFNYARFRKTSIINDQRAFLWYFIFWFSEIGICYGIMYSFAFHGGFQFFSFYPDFKYLFVLIIIVLFLQTWNTIRISFRRESLKWILISAIIVSILSYGLSKINIVDYKSLNELVLQSKIPYKYNLTLVESNIYQMPERPRLLENIYVVRPKTQNNSDESIIIINKTEVPPDSVYYKLQELKSKKDFVDNRLTTYRLNIDKEIKTKAVNDIKFSISKLGATKIAYAVVPPNTELSQQFYRDYSFKSFLPGIDSSKFNIWETISYCNKFSKEVEIIQLDNGDCRINNTLVNIDSISSVVKKIILKNNDYYFKFYPNDKVIFSKYFRVIYQLHESVNELRDYYSLNLFAQKFNQLYSYDEIDYVTKKYPLVILEYSDDIIRFLENKKKATLQMN